MGNVMSGKEKKFEGREEDQRGGINKSWRGGINLTGGVNRS